MVNVDDEDEGVPGDDGPGEVVEPAGNGVPTKAVPKAPATDTTEQGDKEGVAVTAGGGDEEN